MFTYIMENREEFVKSEFKKFLEKKSPQCAEVFHSCVDEIVLSYMVSILEDLGSESSLEEAFDVEAFTEMMEAYMPGFSEINSVQTTEWMFELSVKLANPDKEDEKEKEYKKPNELSLRLESQTDSNEKSCSELPQSGDSKVCRSRTNSSRTSSMSECSGRSRKSSTRSLSECEAQNGETVGGKEHEDNLENDEQVQLLLEMFPSACTMEVAHCLCVGNGDLESAAQLMLHRQDTGECFTQQSKTMNHKAVRKKKNHGTTLIGDAEMKKHIIKRYSYVDTDDDKKLHKPVIPKTEPKKMVRYLDGRVVSTRGERFTEIKKEEDENMKKTFVNLKPARQYRFH